ncbi:uncharacterized protein LOC124132955 [Haliotis rufescens]|uniref:uncharacterized protein LOC124132955 n=1 Tax=Haliotis rufescens TaxID=6454 RepID=UPI00201F8BEF|nr:uncharacterized protein LOC124132955 [Haliotis rufescens]XP_046353096.2 uncharacterized protein LOC124132955 [Haliotis rufescens]
MWQAKKVQEFLTCVICQEIYTDPCTLRCDHTFCRKCVTAYIQTRPDAVQSKTIPCAFCRQDTKVPNPSRPVEEWAGQIKPSIIIQGLVDTQSEAMEADTMDNHCSMCIAIGKTTPRAWWCHECEVSLCKTCLKMHHASPISRDHEVADLSEGGPVKKTRKVMCKEHKKEAVSLVCRDCHKAVCPSCCVVYHRRCDSVVTIHSMITTIKYHLTKRRNMMANKIKGKQRMVQKTQERIIRIKEKSKQAEMDVQNDIASAIKKIKQKGERLINEIKEITENESKQLQAGVKHEEIEVQMYRQHCEFIEQTLVSDCEMDLYDAYEAWETREMMDKASASKRRIDDIRFNSDADEVQHILDDLRLGKIDVTYLDQGSCLPTRVVVDTIDGKMESDEKEPSLRDVTVLVVDGMETVVVTDFQNMCVKSFYTKHNRSCHRKLPLRSDPFGITQWKENKVMVAMANSCQILTLEVTPDLKLLSAVSTSKGYFSIAVLGPSTLAAGGHERVDILDISGHVLKSVTERNNKRLFTYPFHMCVNTKGNILVSDWKEKSVTCVTSEGDVVWSYAPTGHRALIYPRGITTTSTGDILLADNFSDKVIELNESWEFVRYILQSKDGKAVISPRGLYVDNRNSLYVCGGRKTIEIIFT